MRKPRPSIRLRSPEAFDALPLVDRELPLHPRSGALPTRASRPSSVPAIDVAGTDATAHSPRASDQPARPYHHGHLPAARLEAVAELIREGGMEAVTLRAVARRVGVSHAAPAHHFGDKSGLLAAFGRQGFDRFTARLAAARDHTEGPPAARLGALALGYLAFARDHQPWFEVMFRPESIGEHTDHLAEYNRGSFEVLADQVRACFLAGTPEQDILWMSVAAWAAVHGFAQLLLDGPLEKMDLAPTEQLAGAVMTTVVQGLRAHSGWFGDIDRLATAGD